MDVYKLQCTNCGDKLSVRHDRAQETARGAVLTREYTCNGCGTDFERGTELPAAPTNVNNGGVQINIQGNVAPGSEILAAGGSIHKHSGSTAKATRVVCPMCDEETVLHDVVDFSQVLEEDGHVYRLMNNGLRIVDEVPTCSSCGRTAKEGQRWLVVR